MTIEQAIAIGIAALLPAVAVYIAAVGRAKDAETKARNLIAEYAKARDQAATKNQEKIEGLETKVDDLKQGQFDLRLESKGLKHDLSLLQIERDSFAQRFETSSTDNRVLLETANTQIGDLKVLLGSANTQIGELKQEVSDLRGEIKQNEIDRRKQAKVADGLRKEVSDLQADGAAQVTPDREG